MAYTNNPYFLPAQEEQQIAGVAPMMQNIAAQQAAQQAAMLQGQQLTQQAGQPGQSSGGAMALAAALRKSKDKGPGLGETTNAAGKVIADPTYGDGGKYGKMTKDELANMMESGI